MTPNYFRHYTYMVPFTLQVDIIVPILFMRNLTHGLKGATGSPSDDPNSNQVLLAYKARLLSIHVILPRMEPASFPNNRGDNYMLSWLLVGHSVPEV